MQECKYDKERDEIKIIQEKLEEYMNKEIKNRRGKIRLYNDVKWRHDKTERWFTRMQKNEQGMAWKDRSCRDNWNKKREKIIQKSLSVLRETVRIIKQKERNND